MLDLKPIKDALAAAPPYPWKVVGENYCLEGFPQVEYADEKQSYIKVHGMADANLIANAPTWLAEMIAEIERLRLAENAMLILKRLADDPEAAPEWDAALAAWERTK